jgi:uncharacterized protein (DUF4213/DUF364 family)
MDILERVPEEGDLPDTAAEYVLPEAEVIFVTGTSIINKTFPRLMELGRQAEIHLVGPSVPLRLEWLGRGLASLSGVLIADYEALAGELEHSSFGTAGFDRNLARRVNYLYRL